jgi:hypothetical protein
MGGMHWNSPKALRRSAWTAVPAAGGTALLALLALLASPAAVAQVYRWVDEQGVTHLSSEKPPPGVKAERIELQGTSKRASGSSNGGSSGASSSSPPASAAQVAGRQELLGRLRTRECVIALESLDRKTAGLEPTSAAEIRRLKQTAELNCSQDAAARRQQEDMAAKLRIANSPTCVEARNRLADMVAPDSTTPREQVRSQQAFVDEHCTAPVR